MSKYTFLWSVKMEVPKLCKTNNIIIWIIFLKITNWCSLMSNLENTQPFLPNTYIHVLLMLTLHMQGIGRLQLRVKSTLKFARKLRFHQLVEPPCLCSKWLLKQCTILRKVLQILSWVYVKFKKGKLSVV